ncbi:hypothetical protein [Methylobacterium sp. WL9]|uniref:hypothetical protein n=1 Tax=Methylobacterium sp. WL9 TaxID=2603898 RepID=UPI0011CB91D7|nr:hypothetical protein [Methylobacterium sp. WL9]TXN19564.1 hypothetical protein FV217_20920 [Methylobacterium sp. WL9]
MHTGFRSIRSTDMTSVASSTAECRRVAAAHVEAARQHAAAADAHATAAEMHFEARQDGDADLQLEAQDASADAAAQTGTAIEASEFTGECILAIRDAGREADEAVRLAEDGEDPRDAHTAAARHHAAVVQRHAEAIEVREPDSENAEDARAEAESAALRAVDAAATLQAAILG